MKLQRRLKMIGMIVLCYFLTSFAQNYGWVKVAQVGDQFASLSAVEFVDSLHGWTAQGGSAIYRTTDGGTSWISYGGTPMGVKSISMVDSLIGWCVGAQASTGKIIKTTTGGATWIDQFITNDRSYNGTAAQTLRKNTTVGGTLNFSPDTGKFVQTTDGGANWTERTSADSFTSLTEVQFLDSLHGWAVAYKKILRTNNGGLSWGVVSLPGPFLGFQTISFIDTLNGWAAANGNPTYSYRTVDGGENWTRFGPIDTLAGEFHAYALFFVNSVDGWAFGDMVFEGDFSGTIFRTHDGGISWHLEFVTHESRSLGSGVMLDRYHGWAVGGAGNVFAYKSITKVVEQLPGLPHSFSLRQNYPNPFNGRTNIEYELQQSSNVTLTISDVNGREVLQLLNTRQDAGVYRVRFDGNTLASGAYYYTIRADSFSDTKSMVLIK